MTESERIAFLINVLEAGNGKAFANKIGASESAVSRMRSGAYGINKQISSIINAYPSVNRNWLETGDGYPGHLTPALVKEHYEEKIRRQESIIDHLMKRIDDLEQQVETI